MNNGGDKWFQVPDHYSNTAAGHSKWVEGIQFHKHRSINWFTNLDHKKRHEKLILYKKYTPEEYPHYDNYDAINVDRVADIPEDYNGVMGVPITFLDKHNPEQFEIIGMGEDNGMGHSGGVWKGGSKSCLVKGKAKFKRIFIRNKQPCQP